MDALDLDHSYCARCETYIWPEKRQVQVQVAARPSPTKAQEESVTKIRTVISLDRAPLYCSVKCQQDDLESGSANGRRIMEHFESPSSCLPSPVSPSHNTDYFTRIAGRPLSWTRRASNTSTRSTTSMSSMELLEEHRQWSRSLLAESAERLSHSESRAAISAESTTLPKPKSKPELKPRDDDTPMAVPFTHRRWKESKDMRTETLSRSIDVDVAALYDQYPMSQRVRSTSSFGSSSSVRRGSMTGSTVSDTASIRTTSSRGSTRRQGSLSADATRGLLVPAVMVRQDSDSRSSDEEPEGYFVRRNRTITQHSISDRRRRDQPHKTIQELVRDASGPEYTSRQGSPAPVSDEHTGPLYEVTHTPPGPTRRHVVQAVQVNGKEELRIVQEDRWEEPQKLFHFTT